MKLYSITFMILISVFIGISCAPSRRMGSVRVVEESGQRRDWVRSDRESFERDNTLHFRGQINDRNDLNIAKREAKAACIVNIAEGINLRVSTEFASAVKGSNVNTGELHNVVQDAVAWVSNKLNIQGISPGRVYWQRLEKITRDGVSYVYNVYMLAEIPVRDYEEAKKLALQELRGQYGREQKKELEEIVGRLMNGLYE